MRVLLQYFSQIHSRVRCPYTRTQKYIPWARCPHTRVHIHTKHVYTHQAVRLGITEHSHMHIDISRTEQVTYHRINIIQQHQATWYFDNKILHPTINTLFKPLHICNHHNVKLTLSVSLNTGLLSL